MDVREQIARVIEPQAWAALGIGDTLAYKNRRTSSLRKADRIIASLAADSRQIIHDSENHGPTMERAGERLRGNWHGVFLDGRNEHGSHVLMLPQRSIELEQDSNGGFLKSQAETILSAAKAMGFEVGDAVVATFNLCLDDGFFSHYEFIEVSAELTAVLYGTPDEQRSIRAMGEKK